MNVDRRTFLRSCAGAAAAAALPAITPCDHDFHPALQYCQKCGRTRERIFFDDKPIVPRIWKTGDYEHVKEQVSIQGTFDAGEVIMIAGSLLERIGSATLTIGKPDEPKRAFVVPINKVKWERVVTAPTICTARG